MNNIFKTVSNKLTGYAPRTKFSLGNTCRTKISFNAGELVPVNIIETLPGDIWQVDLASLTTMQTPIAPIMDDIDQTFYLMYAPLRILDPNFEKAIVISDWDGAVTDKLETFTMVGSSSYSSSDNSTAYLGLGINRNSLGHYVGLPIGIYGGTFHNKIITAPFKGVISIWNYFFRDENYQTEKTLNVNYNTKYSNTSYNTLFTVAGVQASRSKYLNNSATVDIFGSLPIVNEFHDPFTSVLPSPQKGLAVTLPLGDYAPLIGGSTLNPLGQEGFQVGNDELLPLYGGSSLLVDTGGLVGSKLIDGTEEFPEMSVDSMNLVADLSRATAATINTLREAVLMQQFLEKLARSGSRYKEFILAFYNSDIADGRIQKPEFIAEHRCSVNVSEVIQTSGYNNADETTLGTLGARSRTGTSKEGFATFATPEHGYLYLFTVVRHRLSYSQGIHPMFFRQSGLDFYNPAWEGQGEVGVKTVNVLANVGYHPDIMKEEFERAGRDVTLDSELGFNEPFWEYKFFTQRAVGMMNPVAKDGLDYWTLTKTFTSEHINATTLRVSSPDYLDRALSIHHDVADQFIMDCLLTGSVVRRMRYRSTPGQFLRV